LKITENLQQIAVTVDLMEAIEVVHEEARCSEAPDVQKLLMLQKLLKVTLIFTLLLKLLQLNQVHPLNLGLVQLLYHHPHQHHLI